MPTLRICIPAKVYTNTKFTMSLIDCLGRVEAVTGYQPVVKFMCGKSNIDQARSMLATDFYNNSNDDDLMLFIDSDHLFSVEDVKNVIAIGGDVACGIYPNALGKPTCYFMDPQAFVNGTDNRLRYAGTGFMLIRKPIMKKIAKFLESEGTAFARISTPDYERVIPFFKQRIIDSELGPPGCGIKDWVGEDFTFCWLTRHCGGTIRGFFTKTLGHEVANIRIFYPEDAPVVKNGLTLEHQLPITNKSLVEKLNEVVGEPENKNKIYEVEIKKAPTKPEIVYFCGYSRVTFAPDANALGGSEQAVVGLCRNWAEMGYDVTVYGNVKEGIYDEVKYLNVTKFDLTKEYQTLILWRGFGLQILPIIKAKHLYVDLHDPTDPRMLPPEHLDKIETIFVKSNWHKTNWPYIPDSKFTVISNGLNTELYGRIAEEKILREPFRVCYTSCYTRGLLNTLKHVWPLVRKIVPHAELHVCYGDDLITDQELKNQIREAMKQDGVIDHGRLTGEDVARLRASSEMHLYLCTAPAAETDCLSIRESIYAGCVPITFDEGVFKERRVLKLPGTHHKDDRSYQLTAVLVAKLMTENRDLLQKYRELAVEEQNWHDVASQWLKHLRF